MAAFVGEKPLLSPAILLHRRNNDVGAADSGHGYRGLIDHSGSIGMHVCVARGKWFRMPRR